MEGVPVVSLSADTAEQLNRRARKTQNNSLTYLKSLDGIRAFAAFGVVLTHTAFYTGRSLQPDLFAAWLSRLDYGVTLFFVLSGFLLYRSWLQHDFSATARPMTIQVFGNYVRQRILRIYPAYLVTLGVAFALFGTLPLERLDIVQMLTFTHVYAHHGGDHVQLSQMWSLDVEVAFYAALPFLVLLARALPGRSPLHKHAVMLGIIFAVSVIATVALFVTGFASRYPLSLLWLPSKMPWFLGGMALALADAGYRSNTLPTPVRHAIDGLSDIPWTVFLCSTAALVVALTPIAGPYTLAVSTPAQWWTKHVLYGIGALGGVLLVTIVRTPSPIVWILNNPLSRYLGKISYSVFLIHQVCLAAVARLVGVGPFGGQFWIVLIGTCAATIAASTVLYFAVERPAIKYGRARVTRRPNRSRGNRATVPGK